MEMWNLFTSRVPKVRKMPLWRWFLPAWNLNYLGHLLTIPDGKQLPCQDHTHQNILGFTAAGIDRAPKCLLSSRQGSCCHSCFASASQRDAKGKKGGEMLHKHSGLTPEVFGSLSFTSLPPLFPSKGKKMLSATSSQILPFFMAYIPGISKIKMAKDHKISPGRNYPLSKKKVHFLYHIL